MTLQLNAFGALCLGTGIFIWALVVPAWLFQCFSNWLERRKDGANRPGEPLKPIRMIRRPKPYTPPPEY